jgi:hypothetical protein
VNREKLKRLMYELIKKYFAGATVVWGSVRLVNPTPPLVVLSMGSTIRTYQPTTTVKNGIIVNNYPSLAILQVDLYTKGRKTNTSGGVTATYENTAVNDLTAFINFINSVYVDHWTGINDISILSKEIRDLTDVSNDVAWEYRAMAELELGFTERVVGYAGISYEGGVPMYDNGSPKFDSDGYYLDPDGDKVLDDEGEPMRLPLDDQGEPVIPPFEQSPSGGGSQDLADEFTGWFEQVENPKYEKE